MKFKKLKLGKLVEYRNGKLVGWCFFKLCGVYTVV